MLGQTFSMALKAIRSNKVRSALTMLGVIIGVMSVVVLIAIGQGTTQSVTDSIQSMGTNLLTVNISSRRVGRTNSGGGGGMQPDMMVQAMPAGGGGGPTFSFGGGNTSQVGTVILTLADILSLEDSEVIEAVSPTVNGNLTVKAGNNNTTTSIMGVLPAYATIRNQAVQSGRYIRQADVDNRSAVCVVGVDIAQDLFGNTNVVGNTMQINGRPFQIVGVLESMGSTSAGSSDEVVIIPFTLAQRMLNSTSITSFYISAVDSDSVNAAQEVVESYLYKRYKDDSTYNVMNQTEMLDTIGETTGTLTLMLGGIAGISLLVGGIGIMNIMLVSVTERTREIGIRKAVGAKRRNILLQFLIEALVLSGLGGLMGLGLGLVLMRVLETAMGMTTVFSWGVVQLALGFSVAEGVIFGMYPANKASKLRPIVALRYDG